MDGGRPDLIEQLVRAVAAEGLAFSGPLTASDLLVPFTYVWRFVSGGTFASGAWSYRPELVPAHVRPVTEPADLVAQYRTVMGWPADRPVYMTIPWPRLRMWAAARVWFLDDSALPLGGRRYRSFEWSFGTLPDAVQAAVQFLSDGTLPGP